MDASLCIDRPLSEGRLSHLFLDRGGASFFLAAGANTTTKPMHKKIRRNVGGYGIVVAAAARRRNKREGDVWGGFPDTPPFLCAWRKRGAWGYRVWRNDERKKEANKKGIERARKQHTESNEPSFLA